MEKRRWKRDGCCEKGAGRAEIPEEDLPPALPSLHLVVSRGRHEALTCSPFFPQGVVHTVGGYMLYVATTFKYVFDFHAEDVFWCTADIGWITGHSYVTYGPLANGATSVLVRRELGPMATWPSWGMDKMILGDYLPRLLGLEGGGLIQPSVSWRKRSPKGVAYPD